MNKIDFSKDQSYLSSVFLKFTFFYYSYFSSVFLKLTFFYFFSVLFESLVFDLVQHPITIFKLLIYQYI